MQNGDLPNAIGSLSGHHERLSIGGSPNLTVLSANSFPGLSFDYVMLYLSNLETIQSGFLQGGSTKELWLMGLSNLRFDVSFILIEMFSKNYGQHRGKVYSYSFSETSHLMI